MQKVHEKKNVFSTQLTFNIKCFGVMAGLILMLEV